MNVSTVHRHRGLAALCWVVFLMTLTLALDCVILAVRVGPIDTFAIEMIGISAALAFGSGAGFWRFSGASGGRSRGALVLLFVAIVWAGLTAGAMAIFVSTVSVAT